MCGCYVKILLAISIRSAFSQAKMNRFGNTPVRDLQLRIEEQIIDESKPNCLHGDGPNAESQEMAQSLISDFRQFIEDSKDESEAVSIIYSRPHRAGIRYGQSV
jgi:type I restriction enzyme R subunit